MKLENEFLREVSFPVGGIGAGCIGIGGNGSLNEWEIFNHPGKGHRNGIAHFAVKAEKNGKVLSAKILNGDLTHELSGFKIGSEAVFNGFGWGTDITMNGFPHFQKCVFNGEFPMADIAFSDPNFPAEVTLHAWSPFVPGDSDLASMPAAFFEIEFKNTTSDAIDFTGVYVMPTPRDEADHAQRLVQKDDFVQLVFRSGLPKDDFEYVEEAVSTIAEGASWQEYLFRGIARDHIEVYWHDLNQPGPFKNRHYDKTPEDKTALPADGLLASTIHVAPGETKSVRFLITWYKPNCRSSLERVEWFQSVEDLQKRFEKSGIKENRWKNYYTKLCTGADDAGIQMMKKFDSVKEQVSTFRKALHDSNIPAASLEGAVANLAVLVTPTCLRVEDGTFWGWEGIGPRKGSCFGTCQHVWNYAQALSMLFPDLERSIRESQAKYNIQEDGQWNFRLYLPLGTKSFKKDTPACVDGTCGEIMKLYRDWKISGDTEWMKSMWKLVRHALEYAWSLENPHRWDPEKTGVITGRQHNTLDIEQFGPSGWLNGHYLGALKAAAEMADICGEKENAAEYRRMFNNGKEWCEKNLFNGEYFFQKVDLDDKSIIDRFYELDKNPDLYLYYWNPEHKELKLQIADGCSIDSHLGQWYASLYGIGEVFSPEMIHANMNSIYKYNFKPSLREFANTWRVFACNDEGGCTICSWPEGRRKPIIPTFYSSECMTGFEWAAAAHLVMCGEWEKGEELAKAIRGRYNGAKRNPWNEIECGSNYARSMASYAMLQAYSGFCYDMTRGMIGFNPVKPGDLKCFWSLGTVWGTYEKKGNAQTVKVLHGGADFRAFRMQAASLTLNGKTVSGKVIDGEWQADSAVTVKAGDTLQFC